MSIKLKNNETTQMCATAFWIEIRGRRFTSCVLPIQMSSECEHDHSVDLDSVNGVYHIYSNRSENSQLRWTRGETVAIRDGDSEPQDGPYHYYEKLMTVRISGLEHDGVSVTKNATIEKVE